MKNPDRVAAAILVVALAFATAAHWQWLLGVPVGVDEAWTVVVTRRLLTGDRLYTDVFVGTTPLAFQLQWMVAAIWENSVAQLRTIAHVVSLATLLVAWAASRSLEVHPAWSAVLVAAGALWFNPSSDSLYSLLSTLWIAIVLLALSKERSPYRMRWLLVGSVACGLSIATKQNVGVLITLAFTISLLILGVPARSSDRWRLLLGVCVPPVLTLLPTIVHGGFADFLRFALRNKVTYLANASVSYASYVNLTPIGEIRLSGVLEGLREWGVSVPFLLPGLIVILSVWALVCRSADRRLGATLLMTAAAMAGIYPRPDSAHLQIAVPALLLSTVVLLDRCVRLGKALGRFLSASAIGAVLLISALRLQAIDRPTRSVDVEIPELAGLRLVPAARDSLLVQREDVRTGAAGRATLLLHPAAPVLYLISGVRNPTPYDYPLVTPFGPQGQQQVLSAIAAGTLRQVCLYTASWPILEPTALTAGVPKLMRLSQRGRVCDTFVREKP